jgi:hypothetical protein
MSYIMLRPWVLLIVKALEFMGCVSFYKGILFLEGLFFLWSLLGLWVEGCFFVPANWLGIALLSIWILREQGGAGLRPHPLNAQERFKKGLLFLKYLLPGKEFQKNCLEKSYVYFLIFCCLFFSLYVVPAFRPVHFYSIVGFWLSWVMVALCSVLPYKMHKKMILSRGLSLNPATNILRCFYGLCALVVVGALGVLVCPRWPYYLRKAYLYAWGSKAFEAYKHHGNWIYGYKYVLTHSSWIVLPLCALWISLKKYFFLGALFCCFLAIHLYQASYTSFLALSCGGLFLLLSKRNWFFYGTSLLGGAFIMGCPIFLKELFRYSFLMGFLEQHFRSFWIRLLLWSDALEKGDFSSRLLQESIALYLKETPYVPHHYHLHNVFVDTFVKTGFMGLGLVALCWSFAFVIVRKKWGKSWQAGGYGSLLVFAVVEGFSNMNHLFGSMFFSSFAFGCLWMGMVAIVMKDKHNESTVSFL